MAVIRDGPETSQEILAEIRVVKEMVKANGKSLRSMQEDINTLRSSLEANTTRLEKVEKVVALHEERVEAVEKQTKLIRPLQRKVEDGNNRSQRKNKRVLGVPEGAEGHDLISFLQAMIPDVLKLHFTMPFEIERAHRVTMQSKAINKRPRPIILKVLCFQQVLQIMGAARALTALEYQGHKLLFFLDFARAMVDRRRSLLALHPCLIQLKACFGLLYPARMKVTLHNQTKTFDDSRDLCAFLEEMELAVMQ